MALTTKKSTTLNGTSKITTSNGDVAVVTLTANISESGNSNVVHTIINQDLYDANKVECRADIDSFTAEVRKIEDETSAE